MGEWMLAALAAAEADAVGSLHQLTERSVEAFAQCDGSWFDENLSTDFVGTLGDGRRVDKVRLLTPGGKGGLVENVTCDDVDVRPFGQLGIVHGVAHCSLGDSRTATRFTQVWLVRDGRWQLATAQLTRVAPNASGRII